jgi:hypothetical protein
LSENLGDKELFSFWGKVIIMAMVNVDNIEQHMCIISKQKKIKLHQCSIIIIGFLKLALSHNLIFNQK